MATDEKYHRMYGTVHVSAYDFPVGVPSDMILPDVLPLRYKIELPLSERRRFGEFGMEINRLEAKIERLEKVLASKSIPKNITTSSLEELAKTTLEKELNETLYEPLTKGIAILAGATAIASITVSIIFFFPLAILSGLFWLTYKKLKQKRTSPSTYYLSEKKIFNLENLLKKEKITTE